MRLIDPIELKRAISVAAMSNNYKTLEQIIDEQPTIERKTGKWLFPYGDKKYKRCSVCERDYYSIPHNSNFCPNCGADMRGES